MKKIILLIIVGLLFSLTNLFAQDSFEDCFALKRIRAKAGGASAYEAVEIAEAICYGKFYPNKKRVAFKEQNSLEKKDSSKDSSKVVTQKTNEQQENNAYEVVATQLRVNWELQDAGILVSNNKSVKQTTPNEKTPVAEITGNSDNLNLRFTGKNSDLNLNYSKNGRQEITTSTSRRYGGWNLGSSLTIGRDSASSDANISNSEKIHINHKSGLRVNFNRIHTEGSDPINSGEVGFTTKGKKYYDTLDGSLIFNNGFTTRIQMNQKF